MQTMMLNRKANSALFHTSVAAPKVSLQRLVLAPASTKLYVGNLSWSTTQDDLAEFFARFGSVEDAFVATDRETGRSRGFGFVTMDSDAAKQAISECDNSDLMGRNIRVNEAQPREDRPPRERYERTERRSYGDGERGGERRSYGDGERGGRGGYSGGRGGGRGGYDRRSSGSGSYGSRRESAEE